MAAGGLTVKHRVAVSFPLPDVDLQLSLCQGRDQSVLVIPLVLALPLMVIGPHKPNK